jgi:hypothetical protein
MRGNGVYSKAMSLLSCSISEKNKENALSKAMLGMFAKFRKATIFAPSRMFVHLFVRPHETTRLPLDGFSLNLTLELLSKICHENSISIKI